MFNEIQKFDFPVRKAHVSELNLEPSKGGTHVILARPGGNVPGAKNKILALCSEDYEVVPNVEIVETVSQVMGAELTGCRNRDSKQFDFYWKVNGLIPMPGGDLVQPMLHIANSYTAKDSLVADMDLFRQVCTNGLVVPYRGELEYQRRLGKVHTGEVLEAVRNLGEWVEQILENMTKDVQTVYQPLFDRTVPDYSSRILEVVSSTGVFNKKLSDYAASIAELERIAFDLPATDWLTYNAINQVIYDDELFSKTTGERRYLDEKVLKFMLR